MGLFSRKPKVVKRIRDAAWGHMVSVHKIDVDTLDRDIRAVEKDGTSNGHPVTFLRVFKPEQAAAKGIEVTGWETFDEHPELMLYEGYMTDREAHLEPGPSAAKARIQGGQLDG